MFSLSKDCRSSVVLIQIDSIVDSFPKKKPLTQSTAPLPKVSQAERVPDVMRLSDIVHIPSSQEDSSESQIPFLEQKIVPLNDAPRRLTELEGPPKTSQANQNVLSRLKTPNQSPRQDDTVTRSGRQRVVNHLGQLEPESATESEESIKGKGTSSNGKDNDTPRVVSPEMATNQGADPDPEAVVVLSQSSDSDLTALEPSQPQTVNQMAASPSQNVRETVPSPEPVELPEKYEQDVGMEDAG